MKQKVCVSGLHVPCVAKTDATLIGHLVRAVLKTNYLLSFAKLLLAELSLVSIGLARTQARQTVLLRFSTQCMQAQAHLMQILAFVQVDRLERLRVA